MQRFTIRFTLTTVILILIFPIGLAQTGALPREDSGYIPPDNINTLQGQTGYISRSGRFILRQLFEAGGEFSEGLADVKFAGTKWGYIDRSGKMVIMPRFDDTDSFSEGLAAVKIGCKWGYIDKTGRLIIPAQFDEAERFSDGLARVKTGDRTSYVDRSGRLTVSARANGDYWDFFEGRARRNED